MDRVLAILNKEWREALKNGMLLFSGIILALVFTAIPLIFLKIGSSIPIQPGKDWRRVTPPGARDNPALAGLEGRELIQAYLGSQVTVMFLIAPITLPMVIASYSIVGEKRERSLEPLLATPVTVPELLLAKATAAAVPGIVMGWSSFTLYAIGAYFMAVSPVVYDRLLGTPLLLSVAFVEPLLAILSAVAGLMVSSHTNDPRMAQSVGGLIIVPVIALLPVQIMGRFMLSSGTVVVAI